MQGTYKRLISRLAGVRARVTSALQNIIHHAPEEKTVTDNLQGFQNMNPAEHREAARKGGKIAHERGTAHEWTAQEAVEAGRKGGETVSRDRQHMRDLGKLGGVASGEARRKRKAQRDLDDLPFVK